MKFIYILLVILTGSIFKMNAQQAQTKEILPIRVDRSVLSGVGLKKIDLKNVPEKDFFQKNLYSGEDISVYVVSSESWKNVFEDFWFDEFLCILHGQARINPIDEAEQTLYSGDLFFAPKGYTGEWEIQAGDQYHYELSVITTQRAPKDQVASYKGPVLLDRGKLSGTDIKLDKNGAFQEVLASGPELTITMNASTPDKKQISEPMTEQMVHVLSGQISVGISEEESETFYTGDYFILPKGFVGQWKSEGHGIVKYLSIFKTVES